jgi:hypothetical protein
MPKAPITIMEIGVHQSPGIAFGMWFCQFIYNIKLSIFHTSFKLDIDFETKNYP